MGQYYMPILGNIYGLNCKVFSQKVADYSQAKFAKTHNPDYVLVNSLANSILRPAKWDADCDKLTLIDRAICFFSRPNDKADEYIDAINQLSPQAYAPHKKRSRIFKSISFL